MADKWEEKFMNQVVSGAEPQNYYEALLASHTCTFGLYIELSTAGKSIEHDGFVGKFHMAQESVKQPKK